jgi:paraquat-inducible protein B
MNNDKTNSQPPEATPTAEVRTKQGISVVWLIPLIALLIGGWLAYKSISEKGPLISIRFKTAEGLEAEKTKIKFKDVIIGAVEDIQLSKEKDEVIVLARMDNEAKPYLTENTRFWVVRATISGGQISALGTLLSGAYIGVDPVKKGKRTREFIGLEKRPLVTADIPGEHYMLTSPTLGSLDIGSPIFYRKIRVGEVVDYNFDKTGEAIDIKVFIRAPHHIRISTATKFWNASGIDITLDTSGIKVDTQSLVSILQGGIVFDTPATLESQTGVSEDFQFQLFPNQKQAKEKTYTIKSYYMMYFEQSVRGLLPGAPIEFRGFRIGEVVDVKLIVELDKQEARIPVLVMLEPERFEIWAKGEKIDHAQVRDQVSGTEKPKQWSLITHGLRARLKTGNLLTGQLYIDMDMYPDAEPVQIVYKNGYPVFPTVPSGLGQIVENINTVLKKIERIPIEELGENLNETIITLRSTLKEFKGVAGNINQQVLPNMEQTLTNINKQLLPVLNQTMEDLQDTMAGLKHIVGTDSALDFKTQQALDELTSAIRSIKSVADQLDRNPRALIFGRGESKP